MIDPLTRIWADGAGVADQFDQGEYAWDEIEGLVAVDGLSVDLHED